MLKENVLHSSHILKTSQTLISEEKGDQRNKRELRKKPE